MKKGLFHHVVSLKLPRRIHLRMTSQLMGLARTEIIYVTFLHPLEVENSVCAAHFFPLKHKTFIFSSCLTGKTITEQVYEFHFNFIVFKFMNAMNHDFTNICYKFLIDFFRCILYLKLLCFCMHHVLQSCGKHPNRIIETIAFFLSLS